MKAPGFGDNRKNQLRDMAVASGGAVSLKGHTMTSDLCLVGLVLYAVKMTLKLHTVMLINEKYRHPFVFFVFV